MRYSIMIEVRLNTRSVCHTVRAAVTRQPADPDKWSSVAPVVERS
jgi:hypothetical protein